MKQNTHIFVIFFSSIFFTQFQTESYLINSILIFSPNSVGPCLYKLYSMLRILLSVYFWLKKKACTHYIHNLFRHFRDHITWNQRKIYIITLFLERIKVVGYVLFIIMFFVVGFVRKEIELRNMSE